MPWYNGGSLDARSAAARRGLPRGAAAARGARQAARLRRVSVSRRRRPATPAAHWGASRSRARTRGRQLSRRCIQITQAPRRFLGDDGAPVVALGAQPGDVGVAVVVAVDLRRDHEVVDVSSTTGMRRSCRTVAGTWAVRLSSVHRRSLFTDLTVSECDLMLRSAAKREPQRRGTRMVGPHAILAVLPSSPVLASGARSRLASAERCACSTPVEMRTGRIPGTSPCGQPSPTPPRCRRPTTWSSARMSRHGGASVSGEPSTDESSVGPRRRGGTSP